MNFGAGLFSNFARICDNLRIGRIARRSRHADRRPQARAREQQRVRHVVAIAHIRQTAVLHISKPLQQREIVGQRLAGMLQIAERVNHRHTSVLRHAFDGLLRERAQHNQVHPSLQVVRHVAQLLARIESFVSLVDKHRRAAQAHHSGLERQPGSQRRLLEEHHHLPPASALRKSAGRAFMIPARFKTASTPAGPRSRVETRSGHQNPCGTLAGSGRHPALHVTIQL